LPGDAADMPPAAQPGLFRPPPDIACRILPSRPIANVSKWYAIPIGPASHPIISSNPSVWQAFSEGEQSYGKSFKRNKGGYNAAVAHILSHYARHQFPAGMCPNCFLFHLPAACTSPTYNWNALVDPTCHQACNLCGLSHHLGPCPRLAL